MAHGGAQAHFCVPMCDWLDMAYPGHWIRCEAPVLWPTITRYHTVRFLSNGPFQGIDTLRLSKYTNGLSCSSECYLYFGDTTLLRIVHPSIPTALSKLL
ncbi:hypothetical protein TNCV_855751 [Trichonephila clavipes]|nr:hypothetical protein TNCV_855751 [Trichonephila clavipes]